MARYKDDGVPYEVNSPFCQSRTNITVRQSKSLEDREMEKHFAPLWRVLTNKIEALFRDGDDTGSFIVPALDVPFTGSQHQGS